MNFKGFTGEKHPEVHETHPRSNPRKSGQLTDEQIEEYKKNGFLLVKNFFTKEEIEDCRKEVEQLVENLAQKMYRDGKIKDLYKDKSFYDRLIYMENDFPGTNIILHKVGNLPQPFINIASHEKLLNLMEDFLGPNITFNPVWNLRTKTPKNAATEVPWHQDAGYFDTEVYDMLVMTAWIPLVDATLQNGTMEMVRKGHKEGLVAKHECCAGPTWYLMLHETEMESRLGVDLKKDAEMIDVSMGSFILFNQFTPHRSLPNTSSVIRWALDFRWHQTGKPAGLYGLKEGCELRRGGDPNFKADWSIFNAIDRNDKQHEASGAKNDEYSTTIIGPWMGQWPMTNHNRHTDSYVDDKTKWDVNMVHG